MRKFSIFLFFLWACDVGDDHMSRLFQRVDMGKLGGTGQAVPPASAAGVKAYGQPVGILNFDGAAKDDPQVLTIDVGALNGPVGPLVGLLEWGVGHSQRFQAEFDVPDAQQVGAQIPNYPVLPPSGTRVSIVATSFTLSVRNDGNVLPETGSAPLGGALLTRRAIVSAFVGHGTRPSNGGQGGAFRTIYAVNGGALGAGVAATPVYIPPFAVSLRVVRFDAGQSVAVRFIGSNLAFSFIDGPYNVAANVLCPDISIPGGATAVHITNTGAGAIDTLAIQYRLSL